MKKTLLEPTEENIRKTLKDNLLGRNDKLVTFLEILDCIEDNFSIAIDSSWGNGKTFFVKQIKYILDCISFGEENDLNFANTIFHTNILRSNQNLCVYYDAWDNDDSIDPILSLVYEISKQQKINLKLKDNNSSLEKLKKFSSVFLDSFNASITTKDGTTISINPKLSGIVDALSNIDKLQKINKEKELKNPLNSFFDSLLPEVANRLVIIIDELDRCKPDFAVTLLERVKHYFCNPNITFVFAINISELQHTIKNFYGDAFNGLEYLDRFFDLRFELPTYIPENYYDFIELPNDSKYNHFIPRIIIKSFNLSLREIERFRNFYKLSSRKFFGNNNFGGEEDMGNLFCVAYILPLMIVLKLKDSNRYNNFVMGNGFEELNIYEEEAKGIMNFLNVEPLSFKTTLKNVYKTIFNYGTNDWNSAYNGKVFGKCRFYSRTKDLLLKSVSLFDGFAQVRD